MSLLLRFVAEAVLEKGIQGLFQMVPGGALAYELGSRVLEKYREHGQEVRLKAEIEQLAQTSQELIGPEAQSATQEALATTHVQVEAHEALRLQQYLSSIPDAVRASLKRPEDPSGKSIPARLTLNTPDDLLRFLPPRSPRFLPGDSFPGKPGWILASLLGMGGFGEVWLARHASSTAINGAVKFCLGQSGEQLIHEAALIDRIMQVGRHPNIVPLLDVNLSGDTPWLMFEYISGGTMTDWIHQLARKPADVRLKQVIAAIQQLLDAVGMFHSLKPPLVHRDLKPSNILLDKRNKTLRITDFGIGAITAGEQLQQESRGETSRAGRMISALRGSYTPIYSSPQQRAGGEPDPRDDVHALGVIAYQMLSGDLSQGAGPDFAEELREVGIPDELISLLGRCVASRAERRPADANELKRLWISTTAARPASPPSVKPTVEVTPQPVGSPPPAPPPSVKPEYPVAIPVFSPPPPPPVKPEAPATVPVPMPVVQAKVATDDCDTIKDPTVRDWCRQAHAGGVIAMYNMGVMYRDGDRVARDYRKAVEWFRRAAEANYPAAMNNLGLMHNQGLGVPQSHSQALHWYRKAAEAGHTLAMRNVGLMYRDGEGIPVDYRQAMHWFRKGAEAGESGSMLNLGIMYDSGQGVPVDHAQAFSWYLKAAELDYPDAAYNVGWMYDNGQGVTRDYRQALKWYQRAAELGFPDAMLNLGVMYQNGKGVAVDPRLAVHWYQKAAEAGQTLGMCNLARLYEIGEGVPTNRKLALEWYRKALAAGEERAREAIRRLGG